MNKRGWLRRWSQKLGEGGVKSPLGGAMRLEGRAKSLEGGPKSQTSQTKCCKWSCLMIIPRLGELIKKNSSFALFQSSYDLRSSILPSILSLFGLKCLYLLSYTGPTIIFSVYWGGITCFLASTGLQMDFIQESHLPWIRWFEWISGLWTDAIRG